MRLTFTKGRGKYDRLQIERDGLLLDAIDCPKQGIIPHDMVHYAVESVLADGGFLKLVAAGAEARFTTTGGMAEEAVERLVETFQAEMWGGRVPVDTLIATYEHACSARGHSAIPTTGAEVEAIRTRLDELTARWSAVPMSGSMTVEL